IAIAVPTPVSTLVHSSTLVTAGVYIIIRFQKFLITTNINTSLCFISVITIFIAGLMANFENDFKKIIALSTLRQLGLIIIILRLGQSILTFYHLLTHAIFKSILFMAAGSIIHSLKNNQDIRLLGNLNETIPFTIIRLLISNLALIKENNTINLSIIIIILFRVSIGSLIN
ncbi:NADH-ubiquinone oxidoreductase chain 5, partial [Trachymyrmex zeteki]